MDDSSTSTAIAGADPAAAGLVAEPVADPVANGVDLGFTIAVDAFSGPLDLLLFLVRKSELDIIDIPVATIADQFVALITQWQRDGDLDLEGAGDFILLAATLLEIKARTIAPPPVDEQETATDEGDDLLDPRADLIGKLLAYRRFKEAVGILNRLEAERALRVPRQLREEIPEDPDEAAGIDLGELDAGQLSQLWTTLLARLGGTGPRTVMKDDLPIELSIRKLAEQAEQQPEISLHGLFAAEPSLQGRVSMLMATLECARQRIVHATQAEQYGDVTLRFRPPAERLIVAVEFAPEEVSKKRRRRPPLVTFQAPIALTTEETEDPTAEPDEKHETDEERFLRELNERCDLDGVLARVQDVEKGFQQYWEVLHPPAPAPVVEPAVALGAASGAEPVPALTETALSPTEVPAAIEPMPAVEVVPVVDLSAPLLVAEPAATVSEVAPVPDFACLELASSRADSTVVEPVAETLGLSTSAIELLLAPAASEAALPEEAITAPVLEAMGSSTAVAEHIPVPTPTQVVLAEETTAAPVAETLAFSTAVAELLSVAITSAAAPQEAAEVTVHVPVEMPSVAAEESPRFLSRTTDPITIEIAEPTPPAAVTLIAEMQVPEPSERPAASVIASPSSTICESALAMDDHASAIPAVEEPQALSTEIPAPAAFVGDAAEPFVQSPSIADSTMAPSASEAGNHAAPVTAAVLLVPADEMPPPARAVDDQALLFSAPPDEHEEINAESGLPAAAAEPLLVAIEPGPSATQLVPVTIVPEPVPELDSDAARPQVSDAEIRLAPESIALEITASPEPMTHAIASQPPIGMPSSRRSSRTLLLILGLSAGAALAGWWGVTTANVEPPVASPLPVEPSVPAVNVAQPEASLAVSVNTASIPAPTPVLTPSLPRRMVEPEPRLMAAVLGQPEQWLARSIWPLAVPWYACLPVAPLPTSIFAFVPPPPVLTGLPVAAFIREGAWAWCVVGAWMLPPVTVVPADAFVPDTTPPASLTAWATAPDLSGVPVMTFTRPTGWALLAGR